MTRAFDGIRVIDFSQVLAGPYATAQLALLGAEVIKIEQPGKGDQTRQLMTEPRFADIGMAPTYLAANAGKRSITLDLKKPAAAEVVHRLVRGGDVVVQNFKAGVIDRLGFGYEALKSINPSLIYCSISGYGQQGPKAGAAAYDGAVQAASGMMSITGHPETGPARAGFTAVDFATGTTAAFAITAALLRREKTGEGQFLDVAMFDTALNFISSQAVSYMIEGSVPPLRGNRSPTGQPTGDVFPTADGYLQITALTDDQVRKLCEAVGRPDLPDDPRFANADARRENGDAMRAALVESLANAGTADWEARFAAVALPFARVATIPEALKEPQLNHRNTLMSVPTPAIMGPDFGDRLTLINAGFSAGEDGPGVDKAPPALGEHTDEVLAEIGYDLTDITALREAGVV